MNPESHEGEKKKIQVPKRHRLPPGPEPHIPPHRSTHVTDLYALAHCNVSPPEQGSHQLGIARQDQAESGASSAARCVLCLARAPSAVLLPCAHLVLCHICAPALILRSCTVKASIPEVAAQPTKPTWQETVRRASASLERSPELKRRLLGLMPSSEEVVEDEVCECEPGEGLGTVMRRASASHPQHQHRASDQHQQQGQIAPAELATRFQSMQVNHQTILTSKGDAQAQCVVCRAGVVGWLRVYGA